ncbi:FtsK/SpoIIIE domain-containing protein [Metabacillus bambusae]|uniref:DNA translocase FtsK n=1 Tax=Metabacillus bambusae TaxID=2795218 RepID=A0ABS3NC73_9BACI|nr:FtsK/SpoIIIE domain-containing protein [Metabacillus bambusae]MBO1515665.1 DNA translocase FtsK [Metabacillus bambusae]
MFSNIKPFINKMNAKTILKRAFDAGQIYLSARNNGGKELRRYPKIHNVDINQDFTRFVFTLPIGLDPKEISKKGFVFKQVFGPHIELTGEIKKYTLEVYKMGMEISFKYNFEEIRNVINPGKLPIVCGKNRHGQIIWYDMRDLPHILIGGATGSGKSTQLRQLLTTLIIKLKPSELELYLADCKKAEFHIFRNIEHVKGNVVLTKDIKKMLDHISTQMDERSNLLDVFGVAHIDDLPQDQKKPYIVLCIDEFVMLRKEANIMEKLIELTALGRALGIFVILSMQRPVKDVLDTTIRSNLNVAMGFKVRDKIESRVMNTPGSEDITVPGRFFMDTNGDMTEIQSPFLELEDAKKLLEPFKVAPQDVKEVFEEEPPQNDDTKQLTYDDVFGDDDR